MPRYGAFPPKIQPVHPAKLPTAEKLFEWLTDAVKGGADQWARDTLEDPDPAARLGMGAKKTQP